jgi:hypothetical protein
MILSDEYERYEVTCQGRFIHKKFYWALSKFHARMMAEGDFPACEIIKIELSPVVSSPTYA